MKGETRRVRDADCRALFKSAVVMAAVAVDPECGAAKYEGRDGTPSPPSPTREYRARADRCATPSPMRESDSDDPSGSSAALDVPGRGRGARRAAGRSHRPASSRLRSWRGPIGVGLAGRYLFESQAQQRRPSGRYRGLRRAGWRRCTSRCRCFDSVWGSGSIWQHGRGVGPGVAGNAGTGTRVALVAEAEARPLTFGQLWVAVALSGEFAVARRASRSPGTVACTGCRQSQAHSF